MLIATSAYHLSRFEPPALNIIKSMGVILRARLVQARVLQADAEKAAFLSSISHELRTPLHSLATSLDLAEAALDENDTSNAKSMFRIGRSSSDTLAAILNDVLDFDKLSGQKQGPLIQLDLVEEATKMAKSCWMQYGNRSSGASLVLIHEQRDWVCDIDQAGYIR